MLARIHKSMKEKDEGFTLIELLVVMIIIGILAAIAIPVFLSQRAKARDTATKSDVTNAGKEVASYYVDGTATLTGAVATTSTTNTLTITAGSGATASTVATINLSSGTSAPTGGVVGYVTLASGCTQANSWYVTLTNTAGSQKQYWYSATQGLTSAAPTVCG